MPATALRLQGPKPHGPNCSAPEQMSMARIRRIKRRKINRAAGDSAGVEAVTTPAEQEQSPRRSSRVVIVGDHIFGLKLTKLVAEETDFTVVATASTIREARAYPNEFNADLTVVEVDFGGPGQGITLARELNERSPGCAFMMVCGPFTKATAQALWVFGTDAWSVITQATAKSPGHFAEAVNSAVHGMTWIEPGVKRELSSFGKRPNSFDARKLAIFEREQSQSA